MPQPPKSSKHFTIKGHLLNKLLHSSTTKRPASFLQIATSQELAQNAENNRDQANIIVEELHKLWREIKANPGIVEEERAKRNLLADQPKEILDEVVPFYIEAAKEGVYAPLEDAAAVAKTDFQFYTEAGQLEGPADGLKVEDFWDLGPLEAAKKALGG